MIAALIIVTNSCDNVNEPLNNVKKEEIIFCSLNLDSNVTDIYMLNDNGELLRNVTKAEWGEYAATAISPAGDSLLFYQAWPGYNIDIAMDTYIYNIKEDVISGPITIGHPGNYSPDGKKFVFSRSHSTEDGGYWGIYLYDLTNNTEKKLTKENYSCYNAQISPNGDKICFQTTKFRDPDSISTWQLHIMNIDGTNIVDLTEYKDEYYSANGVFSSNGNSIICDLRVNASLLTNIVEIDISSKSLNYLTHDRNIESIIWAGFRRPTISQETERIYFEVHVPDSELQRMRTELWWIYHNSNGVSCLYKDPIFSAVHPVAGIVSYYENN